MTCKHYRRLQLSSAITQLRHHSNTNIAKPVLQLAVLTNVGVPHKVLFDEVGVFDPEGSGSASPPSKARTGGGRVKSKSVSAKALKAILKGEDNPLKRELVQLVLDWRNAEAVPKRGGFVASGEEIAAGWFIFSCFAAAAPLSCWRLACDFVNCLLGTTEHGFY